MDRLLITMADSGISSSSTSTTSTVYSAGAAGLSGDQMHGVLEEFHAVYESRLRRLDEAEPSEETQQVVGVNHRSSVRILRILTPSTPAVPNCCYSKGSAPY